MAINGNVDVTVARVRGTKPVDADDLWAWVALYTGVRIARKKVCRCHVSPFDAFADQWFRRPPITLTLGPRGGGKSFLSAVRTHLRSRFHRKHSTRILGGSKSQSEQIYNGLNEAIIEGCGPGGSDADSIRALFKESATYRNGSHVSILAASRTSVRGPHVPNLALDEVDEIDPDIRESSLGMAMDRHGYSAAIDMASTWHRLGGPMEGLIGRARDGEFPLYSFCVFDIIEPCSDERSGPHVGGDAKYANCPACPIKKWCHSERDTNGDQPLAKLADGHYGIDSLIQKVGLASSRVFEADYLCRGPKADGIWFPAFNEHEHVSKSAEYDPALPVRVAIDSGVFTGAVWFQSGPAGISIFGDYLSEGLSAESNAKAIIEAGRTLCNGRRDHVCTDPAGGARNPVGPTVIAEYERAGLKRIDRWPMRQVADGLSLVESFVKSADGTIGLRVHPRCVNLIRAFKAYRRAKRAGQWQDRPEDPQHPHEDVMDALRGGLVHAFPDGRAPARSFRRARAAGQY